MFSTTTPGKQDQVWRNFCQTLKRQRTVLVSDLSPYDKLGSSTIQIDMLKIEGGMAAQCCSACITQAALGSCPPADAE
jgi:hypothetical protein